MADEKQIKSKKRVRDKGEVFTNEREVNAMLDLVKQETERIDSRFLEPACGNGNFLIEILRRKLEVVKSRYKKSQWEYEKNGLIAVMSCYGVDIMPDNVLECQNRLFEYFEKEYKALFKKNIKQEYLDIVKFVLSKNILCGDALTLLKNDGTPIVFAEWSNVKGSMFRETDYTMANLLETEDINSLPLFNELKEPVYLPKAVRNFSPKHYLNLKENITNEK